jgi:signal transduction histidine kinase
MLRILHLEDDRVDADLALDLLRQEGMQAESVQVDTLAAFESELKRGGHSLILSDYTIPGVDPLDGLRLARRLRPETPFVFLSGTLGEDVAIETLKQGATDYVLKQKIARLVPAVRRALQEAEEQLRRKDSEAALLQAQAELKAHAATLEKTVAERTARLQEMVQDLESFSYSLSHDMRAPLRAIRNFSQLARDECSGKVEPGTLQLLENVVRASDRMDRLLTDVLAMSQVTRAELRLGLVNIEAIVRDVIQSDAKFQPPAAEVIVETPLLPMCGHETFLTQIVANLLGNAVKFVAPGGRPQVRIRTELRNGSGMNESSPIARGNPADGTTNFVRLWFEDNGIGIPKEAQTGIFELFKRLHSSAEYEGTGLGLAIVRKAAERMGGNAGVESEPGQGSRFWVELPEK